MLEIHKGHFILGFRKYDPVRLLLQAIIMNTAYLSHADAQEEAPCFFT
jgi:hypothetical protein